MERLTSDFAVAADWPTLAVVGAVVVAAAALVTAGALYRRCRHVEATAAELGRSLEQLRSVVLRQRRSQQSLAAGIRRNEERIGQVELRSVSRPYEQAIRMASQGGSEDGLMRYFGLTDGEAALVRLLHGEARRSTSPERSQDSRRA